ncbi:MAG: DUF6378 domain-containing protein [Desulfovibrionaceae bacterium]|nr:DUF6378 domain-containing protein [Desulfovibrionaceae bacterium]
MSESCFDCTHYERGKEYCSRHGASYSYSGHCPEWREQFPEQEPATAQERGAVLMQAHDTINGERQDQYGSPEDNFKAIADFWNEYLSDHLQTSLTAHDVAMMMCLFKIARIKTGAGKEDSYVDLCGYAALAADITKRG